MKSLLKDKLTSTQIGILCNLPGQFHPTNKHISRLVYLKLITGEKSLIRICKNGTKLYSPPVYVRTLLGDSYMKSLMKV
jgi:hypothetical protein